jgi:hypothetical protein
MKSFYFKYLSLSILYFSTIFNSKFFFTTSLVQRMKDLKTLPDWIILLELPFLLEMLLSLMSKTWGDYICPR